MLRRRMTFSTLRSQWLPLRGGSINLFGSSGNLVRDFGAEVELTAAK